MDNYKIIILNIFWIVSLVYCFPKRRKSATAQNFHRTGEAIASDDLITQYEREHQQFYKELIKDGVHLKWPALENRDLSNYCRNYLQHIIPRRNKDSAIGIEVRKTLHYEKENTSITSTIVVVQCTITYKTAKKVYYMTRAHEPNCVYALKSSGHWKENKHSIIHKHCDFESESLMSQSLRKNLKIIGGIHHWTRQPIAKDNYLWEYEIEHYEMVKNRGEGGKRIQWPLEMVHSNLNLYCYQYLGKCCPNKHYKGVLGKWKHAKLHYLKLNIDDVDVTTITCFMTYTSTKLNYHITRAPENNCVYALLRKSNARHDPLIIIFKHCNFEAPANDQKPNTQDNDNLDRTLFLKTEVKKETTTIESLPFFP